VSLSFADVEFWKLSYWGQCVAARIAHHLLLLIDNCIPPHASTIHTDSLCGTPAARLWRLRERFSSDKTRAGSRVTIHSCRAAVAYLILSTMVARRTFIRYTPPPLALILGLPAALIAFSFLRIYYPLAHGDQQPLNIIGETERLIVQYRIKHPDRGRVGRSSF